MKIKKQSPGVYILCDVTKKDNNVKVGEVLEAKKIGRSLPDHSMFFAVATNTLHNLKTNMMPENEKSSVEDFIKTSMLELGFSKKYKMNGKTYQIPLSLKFSKMGKDTFEKVRTSCYETWARLLNVSVEELTNSACDV